MSKTLYFAAESLDNQNPPKLFAKDKYAWVFLKEFMEIFCSLLKPNKVLNCPSVHSFFKNCRVWIKMQGIDKVILVD